MEDWREQKRSFDQDELKNDGRSPICGDVLVVDRNMDKLLSLDELSKGFTYFCFRKKK